VAEYDTAIESPFTTDLELEKSPAENSMPVVLSIVALPPMLIKQPATTPVVVIEKVAAEDVALTPAAAALNTGVLRVPE
jgi:hypothetical protein